jgi:hypothetical protein
MHQRGSERADLQRCVVYRVSHIASASTVWRSFLLTGVKTRA